MTVGTALNLHYSMQLHLSGKARLQSGHMGSCAIPESCCMPTSDAQISLDEVHAMKGINATFGLLH